jgi:hypothetical protein
MFVGAIHRSSQREGAMAEWLRRGLQILARRFDSGSRLHWSGIAQLVEQMTVNHWVAGSSPAAGAINPWNLVPGVFAFAGQFHLFDQAFETATGAYNAMPISTSFCPPRNMIQSH